MVECPTSKHPAPRKVCQWPHWKRLHFWSQVPGANLHETMFQRPGSYRNYGGFNIFNPFEKHWWSWTILPRGKQKIFENITQSYIQCLRLGELFFLGNVWDCWCLAMLILDWLCFTRGIPDSLLQKTAPLLGDTIRRPSCRCGKSLKSFFHSQTWNLVSSFKTMATFRPQVIYRYSSSKCKLDLHRILKQIPCFFSGWIHQHGKNGWN